MKKSIYLIIISIITIIAIVVGVNRFTRNFSFFEKSWNYKSSGDYVEEKQDLEKFVSLYIDASVADVEIVPGDGYRMEFEGTDALVPEVNVSSEKLTIKQKDIQLNNKSSNIRVTIPRGITLDIVEVNNNVGDVDIKDIEANEINISSDVGDTNIKNSSAEKYELSSNVGDIDVKDSKFKFIKATSEVGSIELTGVDDLEKYNADIKADIGDIKYDGKNYSDNYSRVAGSDGYKIILTSEIGSIKVN